jgi:DNA invertase Pin-like site-specific DNA recombinase
MKAILYARVASRPQKENENKIDIQINQFKKYCDQHHIHVEKVYYDIGSGMDFNRMGIKKMISGIENGIVKANLLISTENSRISRDITATFLVSQSLLKHKVELRFINITKNKKEKNGIN